MLALSSEIARPATLKGQEPLNWIGWIALVSAQADLVSDAFPTSRQWIYIKPAQWEMIVREM